VPSWLGKGLALYFFVIESKWGDPGTDERIILRWIFRKWDVEVWN